MAFVFPTFQLGVRNSYRVPQMPNFLVPCLSSFHIVIEKRPNSVCMAIFVPRQRQHRSVDIYRGNPPGSCPTWHPAGTTTSEHLCTYTNRYNFTSDASRTYIHAAIGRSGYRRGLHLCSQWDGYIMDGQKGGKGRASGKVVHQQRRGCGGSTRHSEDKGGFFQW
jgi:hypothetical protein